jgi:3-keto-5-aminohexanoate cleavage enzyme
MGSAFLVLVLAFSMIGTKVVIRVRMGMESARHLSGPIGWPLPVGIDGAKVLSLFNDAATELLVRLDGDEGVFRAYESVEFLAPVFAGDFVEVSAELAKIGDTTREIRFEARKVITHVRQPGVAPTAADALLDPIVVCRAMGTCVTPKELQRRPRELYVPQLPASPLQGPSPVVTPASDRGPRTLASLESHAPEIVLTAAIASSQTPQAIADEAARCREAGAAVVYLLAGKDASLGDAVERIRTKTDCIVQIGTGGLPGMTLDERARVLELKPEMTTLLCGSINVGDDAFVSTRPQIRDLLARARACGAAIELECFDIGHVEEALALGTQSLVPSPLHFQMVLGVAGGIGANEPNLRYMTSLVPRGATWSATFVGPNRQPLSELAMRLGGYVRVGLEESPEHQAVGRAAAYARSLGRTVVDPARARTLLLGAGPGPTMEIPVPPQRPVS